MTKERAAERLVGRVAIASALAAGRRAVYVLHVERRRGDRRLQALAEAARSRKVAVREVSRDELDRLAGGAGHGGCAAEVSVRAPDELEDVLAAAQASPPPFVVYLDGVEDPYNFGRMLRSVEAAGAHGAIVRARHWSWSGPDIARISGGAYDRLPLVMAREPVAALERCREANLRLIAAEPRGGSTYYEADLRGPLVLLVGGEKRGIARSLREICDERLSIPMLGGIISLAACDAAAVLCFEAARQRAVTGSGPGG